MLEFLNIPGEWLIIVGLNFLFILVLFIMNLANRSKIKRLRAKYNKIMSGSDGKSIEDIIEKCIDNVASLKEENRELKTHINNLERNIMYCIQKVGVVRFNAFDNVGSDLSFSIAMLDDNDNGVVISGLYSRDSSSTYAKPVSSGKSRYPLSAEELKAIDIAKKFDRERPYFENQSHT